MLFRVLGPLETCTPGRESLRLARKPATLLASLLAAAGGWVSWEKLIDAIWYEQVPPVSARSNVKSYVWQLRRDLPPAADGPRIEGRTGAYRVRVDAGELDIDCFRQHVVDARRADPAGAVKHLTEALALWRDGPFPELPLETTAPLAANLAELRWEAREMLADALAGQCRHQEAIAVLRELTIEDPLRERPWAQLVRTLHQAGRRSEALVTYRQVHAVLANELGIGPGTELVTAYREAMTGRPRYELSGRTA